MRTHRKLVPLTGPLGAALVSLLLAAPATADVIERSFDVRDGGWFELDTDRGKIDVRTGSSGEVIVEVVRDGARGEKLDVEFEQRGDRVIVKGDWPNMDTSWWRGDRAKIEFNVTVPQRFNLDVSTSGGSIKVDDLDGELRANTSGGSLTFGYIQGQVNAHTSGGSIRLEGGGTDVDLDTSGGSIRVGPVQGSVKARTSGGSISIEEVAGAVDATTSGGSVAATMTQQPTADCNLSTSGGSVTLTIAENLAVDIDATSSSGGVRSDIPIDGKTKHKRALRGSLNGGGPTVRLHTSGGGVRIRSAY